MFEVGKSYRHVAIPYAAEKVFTVTSVNGVWALITYSGGSDKAITHSSYPMHKEVKPKIVKTVWLAHKRSGDTLKFNHDPRQTLHKEVQGNQGTWYPKTGTVIAITEHRVEFEEGEGLDS